MKLVEFNWNPTHRQLKQFGLAALVFLPLAGWLATDKPRSFDALNLPVVGGLAAAGLLLAVLGFTSPRAIKPIFIGVSLVTMPIGMVVGEFVLLAVFFGLFVPVALIFRLIGRDALQRQLDRNAPTYWQPKHQPSNVRSYYRQF